MNAILIKAETKWRDINMERPNFGYHFIVLTPIGERQAIGDPNNFFGYTLTDCTHPLQNTHLGIDKILAWRFVRSEDEGQATKVVLPIFTSNKPRSMFSRILHRIKFLFQ